MDCSKPNMLAQNGVTLRAAELNDLEDIDAFLKQEEPDWPRGSCYFATLLEYCPGCVEVAQTARGDICGLALGLPINDDEGLFDCLLVKRDLRGQGIGRALLQSRLDFLGKRNILLNSTLEGSGMYVRRGFKVFSCEQQQFWSGKVPETWSATVKEQVDGLIVADMKKLNAIDVKEYNCKIQGIRNEWVFEHFLDSKHYVVGKVAFLKKQIVGFAYVLVSPSFHPILTLYADSFSIGEILLASLYKAPRSRNSERWHFVIPLANKDALRLVKSLELLDVEEGSFLTSMYTKHGIPVLWDRIYAVHVTGFNFC